ncbi:hypothetical protein RCL1_001978 [Eukaryota sp. TZLM3-RCL]
MTSHSQGSLSEATCYFRRRIQSDDNFPKVANRLKPQVVICRNCTMHQVFTYKGIDKPICLQNCLELTHCRACLLYGHTNTECLIAKYENCFSINCQDEVTERLLFPSNVFTKTFTKSLSEEIDFGGTEMSLSGFEAEYIRVIEASTEITPLLALISRCYQVLQKPGCFYSFFDKQAVAFSHSKNSFYVQKIDHSFWRRNYYVPHFFRETYAILHFTIE